MPPPRAVHTLALAAALLGPAPARAGGLDVEAWLARPGVRLVAVELYARWCKPCMDAVPRWKALHDKYRDEGLRLVVVSTQDPGGLLVDPGWTPDELVADDQGVIARALGSGDRLPAAFLWSWDGRLLARHAGVDEVEAQVQGWLARTPRVAVEVQALGAGAGIGAAELRALVRERLGDEEKLRVVATQEERAALDRLRAESFGARYDERAQCELGKELPANALLEARVGGSGGAATLALMLLSAERGCLVAGASVPWSPKRAKASVAEAVFGLMQKLRGKLELPTGTVGGPSNGGEARRPVEPEPKPLPPVEPRREDAGVVAAPRREPPTASEPRDARVKLGEARLELVDKVRFGAGTAAVLPASAPLLDGVATVLKEHPELRRLRVECHSDNVGNAGANQTLTRRRAEAVRAELVRRGVEASRIEAAGFGQTRPIADNKAEEGRERNRRCDFMVVR